MAEIEIKSKKYGNKIFIIDDADMELVSRYKWCLSIGRDGQRFYMRAYGKGKTKIWYHRLIMGVTDSNIQVDHINRNTLDNRKNNLRICPNGAANAINRPKQKNNTTGYKGVFQRKEKHYKTPIYRAAIRFQQRLLHLGHFKSPIDAAKAYDQKAKELFGEFAYLNFPEDKA
jgi:hypothetical protein